MNMNLFILSICLSYCLKLIYANFNETTVSNNSDIKNATNVVFNMNIYGQNVEVNLAQNHKIVSPNFNFASEGKSDKYDEKLEINNESRIKNSGQKLKFPDYISEVKPPNSSQIFSRRLSKRYISTDSQGFEKSLFDSHTVSHLNSDKYLELSVFLDYKAYQNLKSNNLFENDDELHELVLGLINQIQAIYYHKSLDQKLHINVVKIEIQKTNKFSDFNGNRNEMLKSFCKYQSKLNPETDSDPLHWDLALLLTGFDLYVIKEDGTKDYHPLGLGSISGICSLERNCVITEFASINKFEPFGPSSGLMSSWSAAHEMAHNLGILHDGLPFNKECPKNGFIMSSSRETRGETNWSKCSAHPDLFWDSDKQCKIFLRDNKAFEFSKTNSKICNETILCATPNRVGIYSSGPALEGTYCGEESLCVDGFCQKSTTDV